VAEAVVGGVGGGGGDGGSGGAPPPRLLGCVTISLMQPEAWLPPPLPSGAPVRAYVSNMAVASAARRRGVARTLLDACGGVAARWGHGSVWLHVADANLAGVALYAAAGFSRAAPAARGGGGLLGALLAPFRQTLLSRPLPPPRPPRPSCVAEDAEPPPAAPSGISGSVRDGVFVWQAVADSPGDGPTPGSADAAAAALSKDGSSSGGSAGASEPQAKPGEAAPGPPLLE
jgi:hypothetical protein